MKSFADSVSPKNFPVKVEEKRQSTYEYMKLHSNYLKSQYGELSEWNEFYEFIDSIEYYKYGHQCHHFYRYLSTYGEIIKKVGTIKRKNILVTGGKCPITEYLSNTNKCYLSESDLRTSIDAPDNYANIIISLEVLEHIKDSPEKSMSEIVLFQESGARQYAREVCRTLKKKGLLILTTPNPNSYRSILQSIQHNSPGIFRPHVREYTKQEVRQIFSDMKVIRYKSMHNMFYIGGSHLEPEAQFKSMQWSTKKRGDNHFFIFKNQRQ